MRDLTPGLMTNSLGAVQAAFDSGTAGEKSTFQSSVSGDGEVLTLAQMTAPATGGPAAGGLRLAADGTTVRWDGDRFAIAVPAPADDSEYGAVWHGRTTYGLGTSGGARAPLSFTSTADGVRVVSAVRVDSTNDYYDMTLPDLYADRNASHTCAVEVWSDDWSAVNELSYYMATTGYAKFLQARWVAANGAQNSGSGLAGSGWRRLWKSSEAFTNSGAFVIGTDQMVSHKFRVTQNVGRSSTIIFRAARLDVPDPRPTISIISDDGYASWHTTALPLLNARGLKAGVAVIADRVGFSGTYVTWSQLADWVAAGHACHTHGPRNALVSLNNYATVPEMVADCVWNRDQIVSNLPSQAGPAGFYVFPQGEYFPSAEGLQSRSLTDALLTAGFTGGRSTILPQTFRADYRRNPAEKMIMPAIAHLWSSTNEAANIAAIVAQIDNCALRGLSACLVFHQVVTTPTTGIQITAANLTTILDRVAYWCSRGYLRNVFAHEQ